MAGYLNNKQKGKTMKIVSKIKNMFKKQPQVIIPIEEIETVDIRIEKIEE